MALRVAVVVSHAPGFGGTPSWGQRSTAVANASAAASSADVEVAEAPRQGGDHPGPLLAVSLGDRLLDAERGHDSSSASKDSSVWKGRTSTLPRQAFEPSAASRSATSRSGASMIQKPPRYSLASRYGPSVITG